MLILAIESSCDETSAAVVKNGRDILSNVVSSQIEIHSPYGGVVPELASRAHLESIIPVVDKSLKEAEITLKEIDAVAVTTGPGLIGSLLVGIETAKVISYTQNIPLITVHHIAGHLYTPFLKFTDKKTLTKGKLTYPYLGLAVSGGHTSLYIVESPTEYKLIGETLDDAAGEAYDKVAKLLNLSYPGGPIIDKIAQNTAQTSITFPRPLAKQNNCSFSFSGLKTAVLNYTKKVGLDKLKEDENHLNEVCKAFQEAVVDILIIKIKFALKKYNLNNLAIVGGVAANGGLREAVKKQFDNINYFIPAPVLCTDNAAMIGGIAYQLQKSNGFTNPDYSLNADTSFKL